MRINVVTAVTVGVGGVLALGLVVQWVQIQSLSQRITALEATNPELAVLDSETDNFRPSRSDRNKTSHGPTAKPHGSTSSYSPKTISSSRDGQSVGAVLHEDQLENQIVDLVDEAQERLHEERRDNWRDMMRERMFDVVGEVARDAELPTKEEEELGRIVDGYMTDRRLIWEDVHDGKGSITEAESDSETLKAEVEREITDKYGSAVFVVVEERLLSRSGRHR
ncbi:MAG: hypothetical protein HN348_05300 [Proteobacteria bacterium]|nr:hypothetical protein [Pseudomonadota bacterium]